VQGIRVREIRKRFSSVQALDGVSFDVESGDVVALLGPNGAGKSTLIRTLGTTVLPDAGTATVAGHDVIRDAMARRSIGLVIGDERSHYWRLSGRRNLAFFAALAGISRREAGDRTARLLDEVELADAADRPVFEYSSGMRARLSLARALLADPPVLLLDEPTRSLDPLAASRFRESVAHLADKRQAAVLFATHDLHEAAAVAARILVLSAGRIVLDADAEGMDGITLEAAFFDAVQSRGEDQIRPEQVVAKA
jgi:ABC-2 type transport system ATP-binding protein